MALPPLTTILNNAPLIIQGANKLISIIREQEDQTDSEKNNQQTDDIKQELDNIYHRLQANDNSNIQQIELIETLAKQNEALANSLQKAVKQLHIISIIAVLALLATISSFILMY